jgi:hypothetical protein
MVHQEQALLGQILRDPATTRAEGLLNQEQVPQLEKAGKGEKFANTNQIFKLL